MNQVGTLSFRPPTRQAIRRGASPVSRTWRLRSTATSTPGTTTANRSPGSKMPTTSWSKATRTRTSGTTLATFAASPVVALSRTGTVSALSISDARVPFMAAVPTPPDFLVAVRAYFLWSESVSGRVPLSHEGGFLSASDSPALGRRLARDFLFAARWASHTVVPGTYLGLPLISTNGALPPRFPTGTGRNVVWRHLPVLCRMPLCRQVWVRFSKRLARAGVRRFLAPRTPAQMRQPLLPLVRDAIVVFHSFPHSGHCHHTAIPLTGRRLKGSRSPFLVECNSPTSLG